MIRLREQVKRLCLDQAVTGVGQVNGIAGQGRRIARDVHHPLRPERNQLLDHAWSGTGARWVQHDDVGALALEIKAGSTSSTVPSCNETLACPQR